MSNEERDACRLAGELEDFLKGHYGIAISDAREDPHVLTFFDHCADRSSFLTENGKRQRSIRHSLVERAYGLANWLRRNESPLQLSARSVDHARLLSDWYSDDRKPRTAIAVRDFRVLIASIETSTPHGKRLKAFLLLLWSTWARPGEIRCRRYPQDVRADYDAGVVITVPRSKTNSGPTPEYLTIAHEPTPEMCPVCALREWLDWLGPDYEGPLFPTVRNGGSQPTSRMMSRVDANTQLLRALRRCGLARKGIVLYSIRRGCATAAAAARWDLTQIQEGLRHRQCRQSVHYIDPDVLFAMMKSSVD